MYLPHLDYITDLLIVSMPGSLLLPFVPPSLAPNPFCLWLTNLSEINVHHDPTLMKC